MYQEWHVDFKLFLKDMGPMPYAGLTLERIDFNDGYRPGNCTWATPLAQARNTRRNVVMEHEGRQFLLIDLIRALRLKTSTVLTRKYRGWPELRWFEPYTLEEAFAAAARAVQPT